MDRIIVFYERQVRRTLESYLEYYHNIRPHRSLTHDSPIPRPVEEPEFGKVIELPVVGERITTTAERPPEAAPIFSPMGDGGRRASRQPYAYPEGGANIHGLTAQVETKAPRLLQGQPFQP